MSMRRDTHPAAGRADELRKWLEGRANRCSRGSQYQPGSRRRPLPKSRSETMVRARPCTRPKANYCDWRVEQAGLIREYIRGQLLSSRNQALMHPPARLAHHQTAERLPDLRLPVAGRSPGPVPEKDADTASLRHTLLVATYGALHDVGPSLRYLRHGTSPGRGRTPT
jgi:hypothetical protein